jgi:YD repeat-containing protein
VVSGSRIAIANAQVAIASEEGPQVVEETAEENPAPIPLPPVGEPVDPQPELEREEALETPQAVAEREESQYAYTDLTPEQAEALLRERFAPQLNQIDADPSRVLADVALEKVVSPTEALVTVDGERSLIESSVPLRAPEEDGEMSKVDLGLAETGSGFVPENSLVDVTLPDSAAGQIQVGDIALEIAGEETAGSAARPFSKEDLYLPEVAEDTSLLFSPITGGVELSALILSRRSPEQISFRVTMPSGAELLPASDGGAEVVDSETGDMLVRIGAPQAVDAQGTMVPSRLSVQEDLVTIEFPHRSLDIAYPLFVDPEIEENWSGFADTSKLNYWNWQWSGVGSEDYIGWRSCIVTCWGNGLYVRSRSNFTYPGGSYGRWWFVPQGSTTYMRRVVFGPMNYDAHGCTANEPHPFVGLWNNGGFWSVLNNAYPSSWATWIDTGEGSLGSGARTAFVGISAAANANISCGHDYRLGGATLFLNDPENPSVSANGYPTGWVKDGSPFTLNVPVYDPGLGVKSATVSPKDSPPLATKELSCTGHYNSQCPANNTFQFAVSADSFDEGEKEVRVSAKDAMAKTSNTASFMMKVDRTPPDATLGGQLAIATKEAEGEAKDPTGFDPLNLPVYNLKIEATDGSNASAATKRSGVKSIEVFLDEKTTPEQTWTNPSCAASCPLTQTYALKLNELTALTHHTLRVVVKDFAGNAPREREIEFEYVPATGMKEEYVLQRFPLPNGQGDEDSEEDPIRPELAVNVMNGNLVYRQLDAEVPGPVADLEVERYYNSLLPDSQDTEWGDGWTLAQTPTLEAEEPEGPGPSTEATLVEDSGAVESQVNLPEQVGEKRFDAQLQAVISKKPTGYEVSDETGESEGTLVFNQAGETIELEAGEYAGVRYDYEEGALAEIAVDDVASTDLTPEEAADREHFEDITPAFKSSSGTYGTALGQFKVPDDVAIDPTDGTLWVSDKENNRLQHLSAAGEPIGQFPVCQDPASVLVEGQGNLYVACLPGLKKYSDTGTLIQTLASRGPGATQVGFVTDMALDAEEELWVVNHEFDKVQHFDSAGAYVGSFSTGEVVERGWGIAVSEDDEIWVTEPVYEHRVAVFDTEGNLLRSFGDPGSGEGLFDFPSDVEFDSHGFAWVADAHNHRVQIFNQAGEYITEFGAKGAGPGQLEGDRWLRLDVGEKGNVWLTDDGNSRVQRWQTPGRLLVDYGATMQDDPSVEVAVDGGLVEAMEGEEVGVVSYQHDDGLLTAVAGPEEETSYEYDENDRMTKVTLANGTYAEIAYESTYGRVKSVSVSIEGATPKTTSFTYEDQPQRKTTVTAPGVPTTTYEFADDGSVLKWSNTKKPPTIDDIGGTLHDIEARETATPIAPGLYNLTVQAFSAEGIASIQVIANDKTLVSEKTCTQVPGPPVECETEKDEWVTETSNWQPGIVYIEVIATDSLGESSAERFWVNIPYTPPPDPEAEEPPKFADILEFREEFGLDLDIKGDEEAINDRIFNLIGDWHNPNTSQGEVARSTMQRWGVPLRLVDAAELAYREEYVDEAAAAIPNWASQIGAYADYAGYYVDHREGGVIFIGFTNQQAARVASIASHLLAPTRVKPFPIQPTNSYDYLQSLQTQLLQAPNPPTSMGTIAINTKANRVDLGASDVPAVASFVDGVLGPGRPVNVFYQPASQRPGFARIKSTEFGPFNAGDLIGNLVPNATRPYLVSWMEEQCSLGWGAWDRGGQAPDGRTLYRHFITTAGHCFRPGTEVIEWGDDGSGYLSWERRVGFIRRYAFNKHASGSATDAEAIRVEDPATVPRLIRAPNGFVQIKGTATVKEGMIVCRAGAFSPNIKCSSVYLPVICDRWNEVDENGNPILCTIETTIPIAAGDSGGPYWEQGTRKAVGTLTGGIGHLSWFTPVREIPEEPAAPGSLSALGSETEPLHLVISK